MSYIFGAGTGISYADLVRAREQQKILQERADALRNKERQANGMPGAIESMFTAWIGKKSQEKADAAREKNDATDKALKQAYINSRRGLFGGTSKPSQPMQKETWGAHGGQGGVTAKPAGRPVDYKPGDKDSFIQAMMPYAMEVSQKTGLDPRLVIAQAAQETGWGRSAPNNNFFGIKSHGKGGGATLSTREVIDGKPVTVNDSFRQYGGMRDSAMDYARFLQENPRYRDMLNAPDLDGQLAALGASGYATDPNYQNAVGSIARNIPMPQGGTMPTRNPSQGQPLPSNNQTAGNMDIQQLLELMNDPYASDADREIYGSMIDRQMKPAEMKIVKMADGFNYYVDPTGQQPARRVNPDIQAAQGQGGTEYGLTPQFGVDENGNPVMLQTSKDGTAIQTQMPDGVSLSREPLRFDAGTHFVLMDPITRQPIGTIPKDNRGAAFDTAAGTVEGRTSAEAQAAAGSDLTAGMNALSLIDSIRNDPNRQIGTGKSYILGKVPGTGAFDFAKKVEQAKSGAFMTAIQQMRGMGALSNAEGQTATAAVTRMNTALSEEGFLEALNDYEKIIQQGIDKAQRNGAVTPQADTAAPPPSGGGVEPWMIETDPATWTEEQKQQAERAWGLR